eukprot:6447966-Prymnesium_polylepis.1
MAYSHPAPAAAAAPPATRTRERSVSLPTPLPTRGAVLKTLLLPVYIPAAIVAVANTALLPFLPVWLRDLGATDASIGIVMGMNGLGGMLAGPPAGVLIAIAGVR